MTSTTTRPVWLPHEEFPFELRTVDLSQGRVGYVDEGVGPTLLFVHAGMWSFLWKEAITRLRNDFRTIALDFPGFGLAGDTSDDPTFPDLSATLAEFVTTLDLTDVTLVAHDLGGPVAIGAAASDSSPYRAMVLTNTFAWEPDKRSLRAMLRVMGSRSFEWLDLRTNLLPAMSSTRFGVGRRLSPAGKRAFRGPFQDRARLRRFHRLMRAAVTSPEFMAMIEATTRDEINDLPVLTIFGARNDPWRFQRRHAEVFPDHEGHTIAKGYHFPMMDEPDLFAQLIRDWITRRVLTGG